MSYGYLVRVSSPVWRASVVDAVVAPSPPVAERSCWTILFRVLSAAYVSAWPQCFELRAVPND